MSKHTELQADLKRISYQLGGAYLTRHARHATFDTFAFVMRVLGHDIRSAQQIAGRHLLAYVTYRELAGVSSRTLANELSHLRVLLRHNGKDGLASNPAYNNQALGVEGGSRLGTKQPLSDAAIHDFQQLMARLGRSGIGEVLELQRALGLREAEAIRSGNPETLSRWTRELTEGQSVRVIEGTKGGRPRDVRPADPNRVRLAIARAEAVLKAADRQYLIPLADGSPTKNLKQSLNVYKNLCHRAGIQSHSARYAFARERLQAYRDQGYSEREARIATSQDLGHGDGRGRYIASVYARDPEPEDE